MTGLTNIMKPNFGRENVLVGHTEAAALQAETFVTGLPFTRSHEQGGA